MKKRPKSTSFFLSILIRYFILLILGVFLPLFYSLLLPLTIYPVYFLLNLFYTASTSGNILLVNGLSIMIIDACVAGSAYYLLLILNLSTSMNSKQRIYSLSFSFFSLLFLNILRIFILSIMFVNNFAYFDITHKIFWYFLSIVFVIGIWFLTVLIFKIKKIPVYSDILSLKKYLT